jgi:membrane protein
VSTEVPSQSGDGGGSRVEDDAPSSPLGVERDSWKFVIKRVARMFVIYECPNLAAGLTFYMLLALFPALIAAFSLLGIVGQENEAADAVLEVLGAVVSEETLAIIRDPIRELSESSVAGFAVVIGLVLAIWSVARFLGALGRAMNRVYGVTEGRMLWRVKPIQLIIAVLVFVLVAIAVVVVLLSAPVAQAVGTALGLGETVLVVWSILRWPTLVVIVVLIVAVLYYFAPNVKHPGFRWMSFGAAIAILVFALASSGFFVYVTNFAEYDRIYGSFAGIFIFLLWLWIGNMALLIGAVFDAEVERVRELQAGIPAEKQIQLPLRDARRIAKVASTDRKNEAEAREIRKS